MALGLDLEGADAVSVILVTFNSSSTILRALNSIPPTSEVIVVDNGSNDATVAMLPSRVEKVIQLKQNMGFGGASNIGTARATRDFVLFLNPDSVLESGALSELVRVARDNPNDAFNPEILDAQGQDGNRSPSRFLNNKRPRKSARTDTLTEFLEVDVLSGAALFCRRDLFDSIGGFDPKLHLYFEDDDLSLRFMKHGCKLIRCRRSIVRHEGGASTPTSSALEQFKNYHWEKSYRYFCHKHGYRYLFFKRLVMNAIRITGSAARYKKDKFDKHFGRLLALAAIDQKYVANRLQKEWLISQPQQALFDHAPQTNDSSTPSPR
ncbi:MAG: glycosyltransferase family 2 protein [Hyphomicrobiaceae bacterium]